MCKKFAGRKGRTRCKKCPIRYHCMDYLSLKGKDKRKKTYSDTQHKGEFKDQKY